MFSSHTNNSKNIFSVKVLRFPLLLLMHIKATYKKKTETTEKDASLKVNGIPAVPQKFSETSELWERDGYKQKLKIYTCFDWLTPISFK